VVVDGVGGAVWVAAGGGVWVEIVHG
jgi:hypothetical protein